MKKILAVLLAGMMAATALAGCGGDDTSKTDDGASKTDSGTSTDSSAFGDEDNITLKIWAPDAAVNVFTQQCEDFKALYPDKTIEVTIVAQGEGDCVTNVINDPEAAADIFSFASDQLTKGVKAGALQPIAYSDQVTERDSEASVSAATMNDKLYAYPETGDNGYYLVYDKSVLSEEQVQTLEGILAGCEAAGKKFIMNVGDGFYGCVIAMTGGVTPQGFEEDGETQKFSEYDEDEAIATLQAFGKLMHDYSATFQSLDVGNIASGFTSGSVAAGVDGSWNTKTDQEALGDNFGAAKLPTIEVNGEAKQLVSMLGYKFIGVNSASKFPRSAQILANYLAGEECQRERAEQLGWGPSNKTVNSEEVVTGSAVLTAIADQGKYSVPQVSISATFWTPMANVGNQLIKKEFNYEDKAAVKDLLDTTINNIRDEA